MKHIGMVVDGQVQHTKCYKFRANPKDVIRLEDWKLIDIDDRCETCQAAYGEMMLRTRIQTERSKPRIIKTYRRRY